MDLDAATPDELLGHAGWLRSLALRLARDEAAADDLVQETWAAALSRRPARADLRSWLAHLLERFARRGRRAEHRRRARERVAAELRLDRGDAEVHGAFLAQRELAALVTALPEPQRTLVMRCSCEGVPPDRRGPLRARLPELEARTRGRLGGGRGSDRRRRRRVTTARRPCAASATLARSRSSPPRSGDWSARRGCARRSGRRSRERA
ncbi:MAG: hypothetical protein GY711_32375 [bacterium]|nr:hypothetical protein [bacterium]